MIHNVNKRNGMRHMKNDNTTAPNIKTTCLRALKLNSGLLGRIRTIRPSLDIKFLAIIVYNMIKMNSGIMKKADIVITKNVMVHTFEACVKQTGTNVPSRYSS